jgi:hypothetical protein
MNHNIVDDHGTDQETARQMLEALNEKGFDNEVEYLALALGKSPDETTAYLAGRTEIDDDLAMKIRGIARERNIPVE